MAYGTVQITGFHKGMISSVTQDLFFNNSPDGSNVQLEGFTWLENFDPNVVIGSIVKRKGFVPRYPSFEYLVPSSTMWVPGMIGLDVNQKKVIKGFGYLRAKRHYSHDNHFMLYTYIDPDAKLHKTSGLFWYSPGKDEPTGTPFQKADKNSYNLYTDIDGDRRGEASNNYNHNGVYAYGNLRDYDTTNNIVLIATEKDRRIFENAGVPIRPVYVFFFDTNDETIEDVLLPYPEPTNINPHRWRVRTTTEDINSIAKIEMLPVPRLTADINSYLVTKDLYPPKTLGLHGYEGTQALDYWFDGNTRSSRGDYSIDYTRGRNSEEVSDLQDIISLVWWESSNAPKHKEDFVYTPGNYIGSIEKTNLADDSALAPYEPGHFESSADVADGEIWTGEARLGLKTKSSFEERYKDYMDPELYNGLPFIVYGKAFSKKADLLYANNLTPNADVYVATHNYDLDKLTLVHATEKRKLKKVADQTSGESFQSLSFSEYWDDYAGNMAYLYEMMYKDYASNNMPRPWFKSERIPYVVTAVVNGAELEVTRDVYVVKNSNVPASNTSAYEADVVGRKAAADDKNTIPAYYPPGSLYPVKPPFRGKALDGAKWHFETGSDEYTFRTQEQNTLAAAKERADLTKKVNVKTAKYYLNHDSCYVYFTLKLNIDPTRLPQGLTELRVYISEPNQVQGVIKRTREGLDFAPSVQGYGMPLVQTEDDNFYRLAKRFIIKGGESDREFDGKWTYFNKAQYGTSGYNATNSWFRFSQKDGEFPNNFTAPPWYDSNPDDSKDFYFAVPEGSGWEKEGLDDLGQDIYSLNFSNNDTRRPLWTPDFCVWDYPANSPALSSNLGAVGEQLWEGKGAKHICTHKGITVIGGCQDKDFNEEVGVVRISMIQSGVPIPDMFREVDKIYASQKSTTALISFRDQIMVFAEDEFSRIASDNVGDISSYRVIERVDGQGVDSKKHITTTPMGVVFANRAGIWITNGTEMQELSEPISPTYRGLIDEGDRQATPSLLREIIVPKSGGIDFKHAELAYDSLENELHVFLPHRDLTQEDFAQFNMLYNVRIQDSLFNSHYILVYNFKNQNWRVIAVPAIIWEGANTDLKYIAHTFGECKFLCPTADGILYPTFSLDRNFYQSMVNNSTHIPQGNDRTGFTLHLTANYFEYGQYIDKYRRMGDVEFSLLRQEYGDSFSNLWRHYINNGNKSGGYFVYTVPQFLTADIGDGVQDYSLKKFGIEASPYSIEAQGSTGLFNAVNKQYDGKDPSIKLYTRVGTNERLWNKGVSYQAYQSPAVDLFGVQMQNAWRQWFVRTSPYRGNKLRFDTRESFKFLTPFGIQFRRAKLRYEGDTLANIRNITLEYTYYQRRVYS